MEHLQGSGTPIVDIRQFRPRYTKCYLAENAAVVPYKFHSFLEYRGWKIQENGVLTEVGHDGGLPNPGKATVERTTKFVQQWLFFELLREVFREDDQFRYRDFIVSDEWINTACLHDYLTRWHEREQEQESGDSRTIRMIRIQQALEAARFYVSHYLAVQTASGIGPIWTVDPAVALSIMVLGEALTRSLIRIQKDPRVKFNLKRWHNHDVSSQGWGYSKMVLDKFEAPSWCPKTKRMLQRLMKENTVGLLLALSYPLDLGLHRGCTVDECQSQKVQARLDAMAAIEHSDHLGPKESQKAQKALFDAVKAPVVKIPLRHGVECTLLQDFSNCKLIGPEESKLISILTDNQIPLFWYDDKECKLHVERMISFKSMHRRPYTVFSHVWTDGFGNHDANTMYHCTVKFLSDLCAGIALRNQRGSSEGGSSYRQLFWIDTLALPAKAIYSDQKNKAIGQIHEVYEHATNTVVLDGGLMKHDLKSYAGAAMTITMSRWMTRLWTLQEAVLSKNILFNFNDEVYSLDEIEKKMVDEDKDFHKCISEAARVYYSGMLGDERGKYRDNKGEVSDKCHPELVASVWRSVQWRGASFRHHETLALAILLNAQVNHFACLSSSKVPAVENQQQFMIRLIKHLSKQNPCAIPAGMIFLPGEKLPQQGYRWAPRTWLTAQEVPSPDPLAHYKDNQQTFLSEKGLMVVFPGFKLHGMEGQLDSLWDSPEFHFPVDFELEDWYLVRRPSEHEPFPTRSDIGQNDKLAIICMHHAVSQKGQIALLVAIREQSGEVLEVHRLSRVILSRERRHNHLQKCKTKFRAYETTMACGEELGDQKWLVDGPDPLSRKSDSKMNQSPNYERDVSSDQQAPPSPENFLKKSARTLTNLFRGNINHKEPEQLPEFSKRKTTPNRKSHSASPG